jgi:hypothetical protein
MTGASKDESYVSFISTTLGVRASNVKIKYAMGGIGKDQAIARLQTLENEKENLLGDGAKVCLDFDENHRRYIQTSAELEESKIEIDLATGKISEHEAVSKLQTLNRWAENLLK